MNTDKIFDACVRFLEYLAAQTGTTYKAINVWIFCVIEPILFMIMLVMLIAQARKIKKFKRSESYQSFK